MSYVDRRVFVNDLRVVGHYFLVAFFALVAVAIFMPLLVLYGVYRLVKSLVVRRNRRHCRESDIAAGVPSFGFGRSGPRDWLPADSAAEP